MANKHGVAGGTYDHTEHGQPHVSHPFWSLGAVADTQHVAHGFEQSIGVLHAPCVVLCARETEEKGATQRKTSFKC